MDTHSIRKALSYSLLAACILTITVSTTGCSGSGGVKSNFNPNPGGPGGSGREFVRAVARHRIEP